MQIQKLNEAERLSWLRLSRTPRIGPVTFQQLIRRFGPPTEALSALPNLSKRNAPLQPPSDAEINAEVADAQAFGARHVASCEEDFPPLLAALDPPPPILTKKGQLALSQRYSIAIVGARNASAAGLKVARDLAAVLGGAEFSIVSGLARGVDAAAHSASLSSGTIAVLAGGIDHAYPPQNKKLYDAIATNGLLLSETPFGHRAVARDFPRRNRLITGLAHGVVVIEAAERSGSLISARLAAEQGREVMAVPGSPLDPRAAGTNHLIRQGATLVRDAEDVVEALRHVISSGMRSPEFEFELEDQPVRQLTNDEISRVMTALSTVPMPIDSIARAAQLSIARCTAALVELELSGHAITFAGGAAVRAPSGH